VLRAVCLVLTHANVFFDFDVLTLARGRVLATVTTNNGIIAIRRGGKGDGQRWTVATGGIEVSSATAVAVEIGLSAMAGRGRMGTRRRRELAGRRGRLARRAGIRTVRATIRPMR
jgi:hypothetical protein